MLPLGSDDLDEAAALYSDPEVMHHIDGGVRNRAQTKSALAAAERCWRAEGWGLWAVRDSVTGALVGEAGLQHLTEVDGATTDFSCTMARRYWGQGYATETGHAVLLDSWDRFKGDLIHAITAPEHKKAAAVLRKLGFRRVDDRLVHGTMQYLWELPRLS